MGEAGISESAQDIGKSIKRKIGDPIADTNIENFEVGVMPYEDAVFQ